jgi:hypothetical protein
MSAFIVSKECMDRVVSAICARSQYGQIIRSFAGIDTNEPSAATEIGRRLFTLNIESIQQRYPDTLDNPDNMPGPCDAKGSTALRMAVTYKAPSISRSPIYSPESLVAGVKALQSLTYQCAEGDVTETPLFKELQAAAGDVAIEIVRRLPAYDKADWG